MSSKRSRGIPPANAGENHLRAQVRSLFGHQCRSQLRATLPRSISHYEVQRKIGVGARGLVYLARDRRQDRRVAIKVPRHYADRQARQRFRREALCAMAVAHPNVVAVYEIIRDGPVDFIVMEYVAGRRLDELIPPRGLPIAKCLDYALQIARALAAVHNAGIMHRDLKPGNCIVTKTGVVKLLDFGLAKVIDHKKARSPAQITSHPDTCDGTILGTVGWMSPEQVRGRPADQRSDIFSFGAIFYEMLAGRRAFQADDDYATMRAILNAQPPSLPERVPIRISRIVRRCLAKEPNQRYRTATQLTADLEKVKRRCSSRRSRPRPLRRCASHK